MKIWINSHKVAVGQRKIDLESVGYRLVEIGYSKEINRLIAGDFVRYKT